MYCLVCGNYLMSSCGEVDCSSCGWKQPPDTCSEREGEYNRGYEDALRAIKINLEHFKKDVYSIELICEGCDIDRYEGESECEKLLFSEILGMEK